ncbi:MAG: 2,3-bisphosphoglycerate-dependent phosphoglycerate mutase [Candidatus Micrarchaeota archaeon]|nr:2,3-bisphosphoglycerate-dependent phosphoglycerate mutase [Candidatus Micrarchaeota archaeon]
MPKLVLVRHGESIWNKQNRFTGWIDVPLSKHGIREAANAGEKLKGMRFDAVYVSHLIRAIQTLYTILSHSEDARVPIMHHEGKVRRRERYSGHMTEELPVFETEKLAERYYGKLQGLNKKETARRMGDDKVHLWRRSFTARPPGGESLKDTLGRTLPYFKKNIMRDLRRGKNVLVVAHGNSLRAIVKYFEGIGDDEIPNVEIPTGIPIVYTLNAKMKVVKKQML